MTHIHGTIEPLFFDRKIHYSLDVTTDCPTCDNGAFIGKDIESGKVELQCENCEWALKLDFDYEEVMKKTIRMICN